MPLSMPLMPLSLITPPPSFQAAALMMPRADELRGAAEADAKYYIIS